MNALASLVESSLVGHGVLEIKEIVFGIVARSWDVLFLKFLFPRSNKYLNFALTKTSYVRECNEYYEFIL